MRLVWIKLLLVIFATKVFSEISVETDKIITKCSPSESFMEHIQLVFNLNNYVILSHLDSSNYTLEYSHQFLQKYSSVSDALPIIYQTIERLQKRSKIPYRKRPGVLLISESIEPLQKYFQDKEKFSLNHFDGTFVFAIVNPELKESYSKDLENLFRQMFVNQNIIKPMVYLTDCNIIERFGMFDTFGFAENKSEENKISKWGQLQWLKMNDTHETKRIVTEKRHVTNFNGYPLNVNQFFRYPTALFERLTPPLLIKSYVYKDINMTAGDFSGLDGLALINMEKALNFTKINIPVVGDFGWMIENGSFVGSIGNVLNGMIDVSFNGRFIKYYDTFDIDFMYPVSFDRFCIVAPKSLRIPQWLAIFQCFDSTVWAIIFAFNLLCGILWFLIKRIYFVIYLKNQHKPMQPFSNKEFIVEKDRIKMKYSMIEIVTEMWNIMFSAPSFHLPDRGTERVFFTACLMVNLVISGTFQGSLYTSYSTVSYYKDIETLAALDQSGLPIVTGSKSLLDIFGLEDLSPLMESLKNKMIINKKNMSSLGQTSYNRDTCCVERKADLNLIINSEYVSPDGAPLVNIVDECPRDYYVSYITRKGWPLLSSFDRKLMFFSEAGLIDKWYKFTEDGIINNKLLHMQREEDSLKALTVIDMQTPFMLLGVGVVLCLFVFLWEILNHRYVNKDAITHLS